MSIERDLIQPGIYHPGGRWLVPGSREGRFTLALCQLVGPTAEIFSVEQDPHALERQRRAVAERFPQTTIRFIQADPAAWLDVRDLDGVLLADVLNRIPLERHQAVLATLVSYLRSGGVLLFIEHEQRRASLRVRNPVDYESFTFLAEDVGLRDVRRLAVAPTGLWHSMYSALGVRG